MLHHASLETDPADADALVAFFGLLGFAEVEPPGRLAERSRWLDRERTQVHLLLTDEAVAPPQGHVAVVLGAAYAETCARLREEGFEVRDRPEHWGVPRAFVRDPAGHRVEVMAAPPPAG